MPRKYELSWDKTHRRWIKTIDGKKHYFEKANRKADIEAYRRSLTQYYKIIGKLDPRQPEVEQEEEQLKIRKRKTGSYKYLATSMAGVAERYFAHHRTRFESGLIASSTLASKAYSMEYFIDVFVRRKAFQPDSVHLLNEQRFAGFNKHLRRLVNENKISFYTARTHQNTVANFITWAWRNNHLEELPRNLDDRELKWIRRRDTQMTSKIRVFQKEDLHTIYNAAYTSPLWCDLRIYMLLGLNCGMTPSEIGSLVWGDFKRDYFSSNRSIHIEKERPKTGVIGNWILWSETLHWMSKRFGNEWKNNIIWKSEEPVFLTQQGNSLSRSIYSRPEDYINYNEVKLRRQTTINKRWTNLQKRALPYWQHDRILSFKYLRKTGATILSAMDINNADRIAQTYLAHTLNTVASRHYVQRDFAAQNTAIIQMGLDLGFHTK